ncbi:MAG: hypothetical protein EA387_12655 [Nitriliruptor sp.]|nr:MAG: hypothetical protein EA387_12655 [Nitriliruptor sp.]
MRELDWFEGPEREDEGPSPTRRRWLLPLMAVPWLVVVALLVLPGRLGSEAETSEPATTPGPPATADAAGAGAGPGAGPEDGAADAHPDEDPATTTAAPPPTTDPGAEAARELPAVTLELEELRGRWRLGPGSEEAAALAVVIARAWLTGLGPRLELEAASPDPTSYAEHLVVEAVEHPSPDTSVVTLLAVLLSDPEDADAAVEVRRLAVPLATDGGEPRPAGAPWSLPGPALTQAEADLQPVDDPAAVLAADTALAVAGLGELAVTDLRTADGWPVVARASDGEQEHTIWLRPHLDGFVVAGSTLAGATGEDEG